MLAALQAAPRRFRLQPLPADAASARQAGTDASLAFAIESARLGRQDTDAQQIFVDALADLIRDALAPDSGDPAFQALVLRGLEPEVEEFVQLQLQFAADHRMLRSAVDAIAHPGKLRGLPPGPLTDALAQLHRLAEGEAWAPLRHAAHILLDLRLDHAVRGVLDQLVAGDVLARLERGAELRAQPAVQRYLALWEKRGPIAGTDAALAQGRASARAGDAAEAAAVHALRAAAELLNRVAPGHREVSRLHTPRGFPGAAEKTKDEWDAAIVHGSDILLLAEVKAAPAAATPDFPRLVRGLQRLAQAEAGATYFFPSAAGDVAVRGASLQRLQPHDATLPSHAIYCCSAAPDTQPAWLSAAAKSLLASEPASLEYARSLAQGAAPAADGLLPVWQALPGAPRLRGALLQYETSRAVREAMLHPDDLLAALADTLANPK
nr:hypothetical protein [Ramlibacter agri]